MVTLSGNCLVSMNTTVNVLVSHFGTSTKKNWVIDIMEHFIDPWLTSKSGECPLCKFDCVAALAPPPEQQPTKEENVSWTSRIKRIFTKRRQRQADVEENHVELESIELSSTATAAPPTAR